MTNEVRKPPRPSVKRMITIRAQIGEWNEHAFSKEELYRICEDLLAELDHKEILPGDDSIRVSRSDLNQLIETLISKSDSRYEGRIRQSFKDSYQHWLKRIERENPPKQDEGK